MKAIYKYQLKTTPEHQTLELPSYAQIITVQAQAKTICFWAIVDVKAEKVTRHFHVLATGQTFDDSPGVIYLGTAHIGEFVWHVVEVLSEDTLKEDT